MGSAFQPAAITARTNVNLTGNKTINAYIYRTIGTLQPNIMPNGQGQISTTPAIKKTDLMADSEPIFIQAQWFAVQFLLSSIGFKAGNGSISGGLIFDNNTVVDWPAVIDPPQNADFTGVTRVQYDNTNFYRMDVGTVTPWLSSLYRANVSTSLQ